jgi:formyltetrahydrofolate deformylase
MSKAIDSMTAVLLLSCPDNSGLVARISHFIFERGGNILDLDEHVDPEEGIFFIRLAWDMTNFSISPEDMKDAFLPLAKEFRAEWELHLPGQKRKVAIFISQYDHCVREILWRYQLGEYNIEIPLAISNHPDLEPLISQYKIPMYVFPITKENKLEQERKEMDLLSAHEIDTIVLARYMQILTEEFVVKYPNKIINIHHSFLPAFAGRDPYGQAYKRGVKIIGATSHYVTSALDEGPIIEQDIIKISHKDSLRQLKQKGRDLERLVLARALQYHTDNRILVRGQKTVIFD